MTLVTAGSVTAQKSASTKLSPEIKYWNRTVAIGDSAATLACGAMKSIALGGSDADMSSSQGQVALALVFVNAIDPALPDLELLKDDFDVLNPPTDYAGHHQQLKTLLATYPTMLRTLRDAADGVTCRKEAAVGETCDRAQKLKRLGAIGPTVNIIPVVTKYGQARKRLADAMEADSIRITVKPFVNVCDEDLGAGK